MYNEIFKGIALKIRVEIKKLVIEENELKLLDYSKEGKKGEIKPQKTNWNK
jgi:hypothetical protein